MYKKIVYICILLLIVALLISCKIVNTYTTPVIQGKILKDSDILNIRPNMSKNTVKFILGTPDIIDTFNSNQFIYINTHKLRVQDDNFSELKLILTFDNEDKLICISGNHAPPSKDQIF